MEFDEFVGVAIGGDGFEVDVLGIESLEEFGVEIMGELDLASVGPGGLGIFHDGILGAQRRWLDLHHI